MSDRSESLPAGALDERGPSSGMVANVDILHDDASIQSFSAGDVIFSEGDPSKR